ncbi:MAG: GNAT family N-acetyltransferase [Dehalococcoidia bacterium]
MRIEIGPFSAAHLDDAGSLLAARHRGDRTAAPELPEEFEDPGFARAQIESALARPATTGVAATVDGRFAGFLLGSIVLPPPNVFWASILSPRSVEIPYAGYAAAGEDAEEIQREMYAALAGGWVAAGCFTHFIEVNANDRIAFDAWFSLGFGQYLTLAARTTEPVSDGTADRRSVEIRRAGADDIETIMHLSNGLWEHHARTPMFVPYLLESVPHLRTYQLDLLSSPESPFWIAYDTDRPAGMQTFHQQTHAEMARPSRGIYLFEGYSDPAVRGSGVGTALLRHSMDWARSVGYEYCTLHYFSANISGARFWQRSGFRPLAHRLVRRIDDRIAWATGRS